jgi:hypothetical protein
MANTVTVDINANDRTGPGVNSAKSNLGTLGKVGGAAMSGIVAGGVAAVGAVAGLGGAIVASVANAQESMASLNMVANQIQFFTGADWENARSLSSDIAKDMASMAANLPGDTQFYSAIASASFSNIAEVFEGDMTRTRETLRNVTEGFGVLGQQSGLTARQTNQAINRIFSGTTTEAQLVATQFGMENQVFMAGMRKAAKERNMTLDELLQGDKAVLTEALEQVLGDAVSPEALEELRSAVTSQFEGLKTNLFDPVIGLFGALREVEIEGVTTTLFKEAGVFFSQMMNLVDSFVSLGDALGITFDPIVTAINIMRWVGTQMDRLGNMLDGLSVPTLDFSMPVGSLFDINVMFRRFIDGASNTINQIDWVSVGVNLANSIGSWILSIDWAALVFTAASNAVAGFGLLDAIAGAILGMLGGIVVAIGQGLQGLALDFAALFTPIEAWYATTASSIRQWTANALASFNSWVANTSAAISNWASNTVASFNSWVSNTAAAITAAFNNILSTVQNGFAGIAGRVGAVIQSIGQAILAAFNAIQQRAASLINMIPGVNIGGGGVANRASGQNVSGLVNAMARERSRQGTGTPVLANSNEIIANRRQLDRGLRGIGQQTMNFSPTVNISTQGGDPRQIALEVEKTLERLFRDSRAQLA